MIEITTFVFFLLIASVMLMLPFLPFIIIGLLIFRWYRKVDNNPELKKYLKNPFVESSAEIKNYAAVHSLQYDSGPTDHIGEGSITKLDRRLKARNIVTGSLQGSPFRFYELAIDQKIFFSSRVNVFRFCYVAEVHLMHEMPYIYIRPKTSSKHQIVRYGSASQVFIGSTFDEHFDVFAQNTQSLDVLALFPPDVQAVLLGYAEDCEMEIKGNKVYFYWPIWLNPNDNVMVLKMPTIDEKFDALARIYKQLGHEMHKQRFKHKQVPVSHSASLSKKGLNNEERKVVLFVLFFFLPLFMFSVLADRYMSESTSTAIGAVMGIVVIGVFVYAISSFLRQADRRQYVRDKFREH